MKCRVVAGVLLVGSLGTLASAQAPAGGEFRVNTYTTGYQANLSVASDAVGNFVVAWQYWPSVASDAAGNFVVVWTSYGQDAGSGSTGVFGQR